MRPAGWLPVLCAVGLCATPAAGATPAPRTVTVRGEGPAVHALVGNRCDRRSGDGQIGCDQAYVPGHPAKGRVAVGPGGDVHIRTSRRATEVFLQLARHVAPGGSLRSPIGFDFDASRSGKDGRRWRAVAPCSLTHVGALSVSVRYRRGGWSTYYVRVRRLPGPCSTS